MTGEEESRGAVTPVGIPSPTLRVIGVGFGRTGTLSLREALVRLGFGPCDHMLENFERPSRFALWAEVVRRKRAGAPIDWRPLLDGYRAIVDWPGAYFWRELIAAHPDARVILTVRDAERWYESAMATIYQPRARAGSSAVARSLMRVLGLVAPSLRRGFQVVNETIWDGTFDGRFQDRDHALRVFREHIEAVQAAVPAERLLVFDVREGWEPLCGFLGVPVPDEQFPHVNDTASFERRIRGRLVRGALQTIALLTSVAALIALLGRVSRRRGRRSGRG